MYLFRNEEVLFSELQSSSGSLEFLTVCTWPTHCDRNGTMVRTVISPKLYAIFLQGFQFPQRSKYGKYYPRGKQKESPAAASGLSPRPTTQLELSIVVSSGTLTCAPKLLFHANNIKNYEFGSPRFYSCSGDKDYSFKRQLQDTWSRLRPCCLSGQNHKLAMLSVLRHHLC